MSPAAAPEDYVGRVNRAIDHIVQGLDRPLKLEHVARAAGFSPFHFHRIFRSLMGETLNEFIRRQRLERALYLMSHGGSRSLTQIGLDCGFSSASDFSRTFKQRYGVPPSAIDLATFRASNRERCEKLFAESANPYRIERLPPGENPYAFEASVRRVPARTMAYGYMWEDPQIVALEDCRYDVAVEVDAMTPAGEIGHIEFPAMTVAEVEVRGSIELEQRTLDWLYGSWLPNSGYLPSDQPCFERWIGHPFEHGHEHFELRVQLPIARGATNERPRSRLGGAG